MLCPLLRGNGGFASPVMPFLKLLHDMVIT